MTSYQWIQVAIVCLMGAMSPGPSLALIIRNTIKKNRINGIITSISHGLGVSLYALFAVLGLGYLIDTHIEIFLTLKIIGSIFLLIIGFIFLFYAGKKEFDYKNESKFSSSSFVQGFLIASNKVIVTTNLGYIILCSLENGKVEKILKISNTELSEPLISDNKLHVMTKSSVVVFDKRSN